MSSDLEENPVFHPLVNPIDTRPDDAVRKFFGHPVPPGQRRFRRGFRGR